MRRQLACSGSGAGDTICVFAAGEGANVFGSGPAAAADDSGTGFDPARSTARVLRWRALLAGPDQIGVDQKRQIGALQDLEAGCDGPRRQAVHPDGEGCEGGDFVDGFIEGLAGEQACAAPGDEAGENGGPAVACSSNGSTIC